MKKRREVWETNRTFKTRPFNKGRRIYCNCDRVLLFRGLTCKNVDAITVEKNTLKKMIRVEAPVTIRLFIPSIGTKLRLEAPWTFTLHNEYRNLKFRDAYFNHIGEDIATRASLATNQCTLFSRIELVVDRIYIKKGLESFNSVTFRVLPLPGYPTLRGRFWVKLSDANNIVCEVIDESSR